MRPRMEARPASALMAKLAKYVQETGGTVELARRDSRTGELLRYQANGGLGSSKEGKLALAHADFKMRTAALAKELGGMDRLEKMEWSIARRKAGNEHFYRKDYERAIQSYLDSLAGLDFGEDESEEKQAKEGIQVPLILNLAAAYAKLGEWEMVLAFCNEAVKVSGGRSAKAFVRRGEAYIHLAESNEHNLALAKRDFCRANEIRPRCADKYFLKLRVALETRRHVKRQRRDMAEKMLQGLDAENEKQRKAEDEKENTGTFEEEISWVTWAVRIVKRCIDSHRKRHGYKFE